MLSLFFKKIAPPPPPLLLCDDVDAQEDSIVDAWWWWWWWYDVVDDDDGMGVFDWWCWAATAASASIRWRIRFCSSKDLKMELRLRSSSSSWRCSCCCCGNDVLLDGGKSYKEGIWFGNGSTSWSIQKLSKKLVKIRWSSSFNKLVLPLFKVVGGAMFWNNESSNNMPEVLSSVTGAGGISSGTGIAKLGSNPKLNWKSERDNGVFNEQVYSQVNAK